MAADHRFISVLRGSVLVAALAIPCARPARASSDGCGPEWRIDLGTMDECRNVAALGPGNDTRVNLLLLLLDRDRAPADAEKPIAEPVLPWRDFRSHFATPDTEGVPGLSAGEGSLCRSDRAGAAGFASAVKAAADLPPAERDALVHARDAVASFCSGGHGDTPLPDDLIHLSRTGAGKAFATYVHGAAAFYSERFNDAADDFALVRNAGDPWLAEAADYMVARTDVNRMQVGAFDAYGTFKGSGQVDQQVAANAQANLEAYLGKHPGGRYARSARGLMRRVAWLAGWTEKLAGLYGALLAQPAAERGIDDVALVEEIDGKLLPDLKPEMTRNPILLAVVDLKGMRRPSTAKGDEWRAAALGRSAVDAQRDAFASAMPLWEFLSAADAFYVEGASDAVVRGLRDETRRRDGDYLWFSRQMLRGAALEAKNDRNAQGFWKELYPGANRPFERSTVELALALHDERHGDLEDVFAPGSLVRNAEVRGILAENVAGPPILRALLQDGTLDRKQRGGALFTLLRKDLTRGFYTDFLSDLGRIAETEPAAGAPGSEVPARDQRLAIFTKGEASGEIDCPTLRSLATRLAERPGSPHDRLCLAEFIRLNADQVNAGSETGFSPGKDSLGSTPSLFPGRPLTRAAVYQGIIADAGAKAEDRSYALYRAVKCYEASGNNGCGGTEVPKAERRAWFTRLKREYPTSRWAQDLQYWW